MCAAPSDTFWSNPAPAGMVLACSPLFNIGVALRVQGLRMYVKSRVAFRCRPGLGLLAIQRQAYSCSRSRVWRIAKMCCSVVQGIILSFVAS